ncbi:MAG: periplasmic-type flagellar collar protein FlbB [Spirochaetia bacterium]
MASRVGAGPRIFVLILFIVFLIIGGVWWFDFLGIINARHYFNPVLRLIGIAPRTQVENIQDPNLLDRERSDMSMESIQLLEEELVQREQAISEREVELQQLYEDLQEREEALEERENSLNQQMNLYDNRRANLEQSAEYLGGMPPQNAVEILLEMNDQDIIDILRTVERLAQDAGEDSVVAFWLSLMPAERAAAIQRKMADRPNEENDQ